MLVQAKHYANPDYVATAYNTFFKQTPQHIGGCLWHSFDHQRGYHPDPFYGGLMDAFRQPKYSYYMFQAQRSTEIKNRFSQTGPMIKIAHEMTPFSGKDVTVFSNCDSVTLQVFKNGKTFSHKKSASKQNMPSPTIIFPNAYDFMADKALSRNDKQSEVYMVASGWVNGKLAVTDTARSSRRPEKIILWADDEGTGLIANGSDIVAIIAAVADDKGVIKRLNNQFIKFTVQGEGRIIGSASAMTNPEPVRWGTAPVLVQSTNRAGAIKITASILFEGVHIPVKGELIINSKPSKDNAIFDEKELAQIGVNKNKQEVDPDKNLPKPSLEEVKKQQDAFGE